MKKAYPTVSVILPVYNAGPYLRNAIESILQQTHTDFEFIIVNDGSIDDSEKIIRGYTDQRIRYYSQENQGLISTLNRLIKLARGKYLARMDQDDVSFPERLKIQVDYMNKNNNLGLVGSWVQVIDKNENLLGTVKYPVTSEFIKAALAVRRRCFVHGSVMMLRSLNPIYSHKFIHAEDYDLWCRLVSVTQAINIPRVLYQWRFHSSSISSTLNIIQKKSAKNIQALYGKSLLLPVSKDLSSSLSEEKKLRGVFPILKLLISLIIHFPFSKFTLKLFRMCFANLILFRK